MQITETLRQTLPDSCGAIASMFGTHGDAYVHQAAGLKTASCLKKWLKPTALVAKSQYGIHTAFRPHENMENPAQLEAFTLVFRDKNQVEMLQLDVDAIGICITCQGLHLAQNNETGTRFDPVGLITHIINRNLSPQMFMSVLMGLGKPHGLRAEKVWRQAIVVVEDAIKATSPQRRAFDKNEKAFYKFLRDAFGGFQKVYTRTRFGVRPEYMANGQPRNVTNLLSYDDAFMVLEITEEAGVVIEFDFASLTPGGAFFSPERLRRILREVPDADAYKEALRTRLYGLDAFSPVHPDILRTRRHILLALNTEVLDTNTPLNDTG